MEFTIYDIAKVSNKLTSKNLSQSLNKASCPAKFKTIVVKEMRKGKLVKCVASIKHYDLEKAIEIYERRLLSGLNNNLYKNTINNLKILNKIKEQ